MNNTIPLKAKIASRVVYLASKFVTNQSIGRLRNISTLLEFLAPKKDKPFFNRIKNALAEDCPKSQLFKRILIESNNNFRDKIIENLLINGAVLNQQKREEAIQQGYQVPTTILISPTMRCNLSCAGCYASSYSRKEDLEFEVIDRIIGEGKELGIAFFTILGGEPFIREDMFEIYSRHNDVFFLIYTNGTMVDKKIGKKIADLGNVMPMVSIEGSKEETDSRRGRGVYEKVLNAMDILRIYSLPFGFSTTVTSRNIQKVTSESFVDSMINRGAVVGWYFLYMPIGKNFDLNLMPTAQQRLYLKQRVHHIRDTKPLFAIDFWSDAPFVNGCIAGKRYIHITHKGDVEPCIFTHFAQENIKNTSLKEVMNCDFFKQIRKRQPYSDNLFRPCMLIDNPEVSRELYEICDIYPTHEGAEKLLFEMNNEIDRYSRDVKNVFDQVWEEEKQNYMRN